MKLDLKKHADIVLAIAVAGIVGAMIVPLPTWLLDGFLALNLAAAATLLVAALYAKDALKVASFPTLLLITTLFRLALNVSSTRLALLNGDAGEVIRAFGEFAVQGEYVVGFVIFAILTLVQFLVVAKGAERVSEVAARFTLDAMPGKQMSIDADLRAGAINQAEARRRRRALERESQLFGAMDGAMKFVKGDAIAGIVIVAINLIGGLCIGVLVHGMSVGDAAKTYFLLAIGDGLVSQIPALCVAVSAGLVVTRVASEDENASLGLDIGSQFFSQPRALYVVAGLLSLLGLLPGMPIVPFFGLAFGAAFLGFRLDRKHKAAAAALAQAQAEAGIHAAHGATPAAAATPSAPAQVTVGTVPLLVDLSVSLTAIAKEDDGRLAVKDLPQLRDALFLDTGLRFPPVRVRQNAGNLPANAYVIAIDEVPCARGSLDPTRLYTGASPSDLNMLGIAFTQAKDPASGRAICAVDPSEKERLQAMGAVVRTARELFLVHLAAVLRRNASQFLGVQETQALLDGLEQSSPALVRSVGEKVPATLLTEVLKTLVDEGVSIRNLRSVLEALVEPGVEGDAAALAERARTSLKRHLSHKFAPEGTLLTLLVDPMVEETLRSATREGRGLALEPAQAMGILDGLKAALRGNPHGVILASPDIRRSLRRLIAAHFPEVAVLTFGELNSDLAVKPVGKLAFAKAA
ncbi:MAG: type III secretion system export apparatus subunit SctV [Deltaproteobacteria bacterium]|nr:type III secretion system export apparatus subunit SctV [Deltaproteobacteria bacterium]